jgi:predicted metalloprotease with PDZ domain
MILPILRSPFYSLFFLFLLLLAGSYRSFSSTTYTISLTDPAQHLVDVQVHLPAGQSDRELQLPVWNALYQIRDFSQYVNWVRAKDNAGNSVPVRKLNKSLWQISGAQNGATIEYQIYADSSGPFGAQLNGHHAFFNPAQLLMYPVNARNESMNVNFEHLPDGWRIATPLQSTADGSFSAENYDRLVDSPVEIGESQESDFDERGAHYRVVVDAAPGDYDMEKIDAMLRRVVSAATSWMDDRPFQTYMFLYHFPRGPAGGGMEHAYSTAIDVNAEAMARSPEILSSVTAHEFFHLWNVKRIRPQALEPVDYTKENYTRALWFSEGCTSTAADIIQLRAGLIDEHEFERQLAGAITELETRPSHLHQSAEESSLDAWLEGYPYYRRPDRSISYYNKGELLGVILDLAVRQASHGQASLREVFQWMNQNFAKQNRFFPDSEGVREAAEAVSHSDLSWFFAKYVAGTEEIPWNDFFHSVGLQLEQQTTEVADPGFSASRNFDAPMRVESVTGGGEAEKAGLKVGDIILQINGKDVGQTASETLEGLNPGDAIALKIRARREGERDIKWKLAARPQLTYELKEMENITSDQAEHRAAWLKGESQNAKAAHN